MKALAKWLIAALILTAEPDARAGAKSIFESINVGEDQVTLKLSSAPQYRSYVLQNPPRLVIELHNTEFQAGVESLQGKGRYVKEIRAGQHAVTPTPVSRVVLVLSEHADYRVQAAGADIVITLAPVVSPTGEPPAAAQAKPSSPGSAPPRAPRVDIMSRLPKKPVILAFDNTNIKEILVLLSIQSGINIISGPDVSGSLTLHLKDVPFDDAFRTILSMMNLTALPAGDNILRVLTPQSLVKGRRAAATGDWEPPALPAGSRSFAGGGSVSSLSFSADGAKLLFNDSTRGTVWIWKAETDSTAALPDLLARRAELHPDGSRVAAVNSEGKLRWGNAKRRDTEDLTHGPNVRALAFSRDGKWLLTGAEDGSLRLWGTGDMESLFGKMALAREGTPVTAVALDGEGRRLAAGGADGSMRLWVRSEAGRKDEIDLVADLSGHSDLVAALAFSPSGETLLAGSWDNTARLWNLARCEKDSAAERRRRALAAKLGRKAEARRRHGDEDERAVSAEPECGPSGAALRHDGDLSAALFDPSGKRVLTAGWDGAARVWDALTGEPLGASMRHPAGIAAAAFSPDGAAVLTGGWDGAARLWDAQTGEPLGRPLLAGGAVTRVAFNPRGRGAAVGTSRGSVHLIPTEWLSDSVAPQGLALRAQAAAHRRVNASGDVESLSLEALAPLLRRLADGEGK